MNALPDPDEIRQTFEDWEAEYLATVAQFSARLEVLENFLVILAEKAGEDPQFFRETMESLAKEWTQNKLAALESKCPGLAALASVFAEGAESVARHKASRNRDQKRKRKS